MICQVKRTNYNDMIDVVALFHNLNFFFEASTSLSYRVSFFLIQLLRTHKGFGFINAHLEN